MSDPDIEDLVPRLRQYRELTDSMRRTMIADALDGLPAVGDRQVADDFEPYAWQDLSAGAGWEHPKYGVNIEHPDEKPDDGDCFYLELTLTDDGLVLDLYDQEGMNLLESYHRTFVELAELTWRRP